MLYLVLITVNEPETCISPVILPNFVTSLSALPKKKYIYPSLFNSNSFRRIQKQNILNKFYYKNRESEHNLLLKIPTNTLFLVVQEVGCNFPKCTL